MESFIESHSQDHQAVFSVDINDIGGGGATLYLLKGGIRPPFPLPGDFMYDLSIGTFNVYYPNGWRAFTIEEIESTIWSPNGNQSVVSFTLGSLPYWAPVELGQERVQSRFCTVEDLLSQFKRAFDVKKISLARLPSTNSEFGLILSPQI